MNFRFFSSLILLSFSIFLLNSCKPKKQVLETTYKVIPSDANQRPKNVILLIGDGMGLAEIYATMISQSDKLHMESAQYIGFINTKSFDNLITDSGAGGTALACGVKTYNGAIGVNSDTVAVKSILEKSAEKGLSTGIVATSSLTHATPASFYAHKSSRKLYNDIANDFYGKNITVAIGGGYENFDITKLKNEGYDVLTSHSSLKSTTSSKFVAFYNTTSFDPPEISKGRGDFLLDGTNKALEVLSKNQKGFFLMIEGSQIDWGGHNNDINYIVAETQDFDRTLGAVLNFAAKDGNTLVIVTADHETGGLTILNDSINPFIFKPHFSTGDHSGVLIPVLSWGPGANVFSGFMDNTDIPRKLEALLDLK